MSKNEPVYAVTLQKLQRIIEQNQATGIFKFRFDVVSQEGAYGWVITVKEGKFKKTFIAYDLIDAVKECINDKELINFLKVRAEYLYQTD